MKRTANCLLNEEGGQGLVEYSLILSLVVIGVITVIKLLGENVFALYLDSIDEMP